jgi:branched-chain amino acid transport system substrate-binding protein
MEKALAKIGVTPVSVGKFKVKDTDMTPQLQEAKAKGADVLLVYGIGPELAAMANNLEKIGWKVEIVGSWTLSMSNFIKNAAKNGDGATMPQTFIESAASSDKSKKFVADYHSKFNETPISVAVAAAQGYDSMYLLKLAIEQAGNTEGSKIKAALENLTATYEGVTGSYTKPFGATDHEAVELANVKMGIVKDGIVILPAAPAPAPVAAPVKAKK